MGETREKHPKIKSENKKGADHLRGLGVDGKILLKWTSNKQNVRIRNELKWLRDGSSVEML
jgi:hypothetical protein